MFAMWKGKENRVVHAAVLENEDVALKRREKKG
jgi:hypothetical protein